MSRYLAAAAGAAAEFIRLMLCDGPDTHDLMIRPTVVLPNNSLHEKCALHLHVSSLQQEQQQQQHHEAQAGAGDAESADESAGNRTDPKTPTVDLAKVSQRCGLSWE